MHIHSLSVGADTPVSAANAEKLHSEAALPAQSRSVMITRAFIAMREAISGMLSMNLKMEQISHKVDQLNSYVEEILHDQNDINRQQEETNTEIALQIEALNDALDQLRAQPETPRKRIGFRQEDTDTGV